MTSSKKRFADIAIAALVLIVVSIMIVPLPTAILDILITANVSIGVLMLLVAIHIRSGVDFASFPTILLITTLYRLALNVSSTRLILLNADAGEVIEAFGNFVVEGNYVVGGVVFLILTLIQFLVIAKGSERVAEVGARFSLDAMPGKQMSIDAELRSGAISQVEAKRQRGALQRESQFYGAMDGAMKFVKGDAIAGIVITVVNIVGGLAIGVMMKDMSAGESLKTYALLTIGDGLVSQIPALLISTAAGIVVTRVASAEKDASLGSDVAKQIFGNSKPLWIAAVFLIILGAIPGLPIIPFFTLAAILIVVAIQTDSDKKPLQERLLDVGRKKKVLAPPSRAPMVPLLVPVALDIEDGLASAIEMASEKPLGEHLDDLREELFFELGIQIPTIQTRRSPALPAGFCAIHVQEVPAERLVIPPGRLLVLDIDQDDAGAEAIAGTQDNCYWVPADHAIALAEAGHDVQTPPGVLKNQIRAALKQHAPGFLGLNEAQHMLDELETTYPALVRNVVPRPVSLTLLTDVLKRLVGEGISVRPLREILEALATHVPNTSDPITLTELVRSALARQIAHQHADAGKVLVYLLDLEIEDVIRESIQRSDQGSFLAIQPAVAGDIIGAIGRECVPARGKRTILTQPDIRRFVRKLVENDYPDLTVLSYQDLTPSVEVQPLGRVQVGA